jgi:hypothetical protein
MKNNLVSKVLFISLILVITNGEAFSQCAMCRSAVESTMSNGRNMSAVGLNTGILYLFLAPYLLVASVGFLWYRTSLKNSRARVALENQLKQVLGKQNSI